MMHPAGESVPKSQYDGFAELYGDGGPFNKLYERPEPLPSSWEGFTAQDRERLSTGPCFLFVVASV